MSKAEDIKNFAVATKNITKARVDKIIRVGSKIKTRNTIQEIDPDVIKFSQSSVNKTKDLVDSMKKHGWKTDKGPIDIVKMRDGTIITADNTRVLAASRAKIKVQAIVRSADETLSPEMAKRFTTRKDGVPKTWGEAIKFRINKQTKTFKETYPNGSYTTSSPD